MSKQYIEQQNEGYRIKNTRVSLVSIVYAFWNGQTAESIAQAFPSLTLEQVYGAITFYLANQSEIDAYLEKTKADFQTLRLNSQSADPMFYQKLTVARRQMQITP